jgi:hypothetical protein
MIRKLTAAALVLLSLTACTPDERVEKAAYGLSEYSCLSLEGHAPRVDATAQNTLETYLKSIQGTQEKNKLNLRLREKLTARCGKLLDTKGVNITMLTEQLITR